LKDNSKFVDTMSPDEAGTFLAAAKKLDENFYLAFRLAIDGMMFLTELVRLKVSDVVSTAEGCHVVLPMPRRHSILTKVELADCETVELLARCATGRGRHECLFPYSKRTFQRTFRKVIARAGLLDYTFMALRQTGILIRCEAIRSGRDIEAAQKAARLFSIESLKPYMPKEGSTVPLTKRVHKLR
jgi:integrase